MKLSGMPAWLAWLLVHVMFLIGFRNRFIVMFQWAWSFISYDRGARLITGPLRRDTERAPANTPSVQEPHASPGSVRRADHLTRFEQVS
jgi:NADH dehydrogenase